MAIGVVDPRRGDRGRCADGGQEAGLLLGAAVLRGREDVGRERHPAGEQGLLGLRLMSPVSRKRSPVSLTSRSTSEELLGSLSVPRWGLSGASTCQPAWAAARCSPTTAVLTGIRRAAAHRWTRSRSTAGSCSGPTSIAPTLRPRSAPGRPSTWSAWKWVRTTSGMLRTPSRRRQPSTRPGSGPVSTTTALPGPAATTTASPWPTSQTMTNQPGGGQAGLSRCTVVTASSTPAHPAAASRRTSGVGATHQSTRVARTSRAAPAAPGSRAPTSATRTSQATGR